MTELSIIYKCIECGAPADVVDGEVIRTCEHEAGVTADMSAKVYGVSSFCGD